MSKKPPIESDPDHDLAEIKNFYDSVYYSDAEAEAATAGRIHNHYLRLFDRLNLDGSQQVLDVACGTGGWLRVCRDKGCSIAGVDLSEKAISICEEILPEGEFFAQPAETLPFDTGRFDLVTCLGSLEHFVDPVSSLKEMSRVAKPDAAIVILVPNKDFLTRRLGLFGGTYQTDAKEVVRTLDEWTELFNKAGLSVAVRWKDLHVLNLDWVTTGPAWSWPLRAAQALMLPLWPLAWQYQVYHRCVKAG